MSKYDNYEDTIEWFDKDVDNGCYYDKFEVSYLSDELKCRHKVMIEKLDSVHYIVKIGKENTHPATKLHFIEWIEIQLKDESVFIKKFFPLEKPEFVLTTEVPVKKVLLSCNVDGIFKEEF